MNKYVSQSTPNLKAGEEGGEESDFDRALQEEVERLWSEAKVLEDTSTGGLLEEIELDDVKVPDLVDINGMKSVDQIAEESMKFPEEEVEKHLKPLIAR
jgi:hypothetical protein